MALTDKDLEKIGEVVDSKLTGALKPIAAKLDSVERDLEQFSTSIKESFNAAEEARSDMEERLDRRLEKLDGNFTKLRTLEKIRKALDQ